MNTRKKAALVAAAIFTVAALAATTNVPWFTEQWNRANQQTAQRAQSGNDDYKRVATWAVRYADLDLGMVEGKATCRWQPISVRTSTSSVPRDLPVQCNVRVRNPRTGQLSVLSADRKDLTLPGKNDTGLQVVLHGQLPGDTVASPPPPLLSLQGGAGEQATISIKNGATESKAQVDVSAAAPADSGQVTLSLDRDINGVFSGEWHYAADPLTERDAKGGGASGIFDTLRDEEVSTVAPGRTGGFLGVQKGRIEWRPLPPTIYAVHVLEDQAEFSGLNNAYRYPFPSRSGSPGDQREINTRTLVVIGRNLPMIESDPVSNIESKDSYSGLHYEIVASRRAKDLTPEYRVLFERAWRDVTADWDPKEAADFRKLDAVLVRVHLGDAFVFAPNPGLKSFTWGTAESSWALQYGDNNADVRFMRFVGRPGGTSVTPSAAPGGSAGRPDDEYETVTRLALPEKVFVEINTGIKLPDSTLPVLLGGRGLSQVSVTATRVAGKDTVYRTPAIAFVGPKGDVAAGGATVIRVPLDGSAVFATVDRAKTNLFRAGVAAAVPGLMHPYDAGVGDEFTTSLKRAAGCEGRNFERENWAEFANQPAARIAGVDVSFGDHATMILLRDTFVRDMRAQIAELQGLAIQPADAADPSDHLVDAWYRTVEPVATHEAPVTQIPDHPLGTLKVSSPRGPVPFVEAYRYSFKAEFQPETTPDGESRYLAWRRQASREAIKFAYKTMLDAAAKAQAVETCDRAALLALTGVGFQHITARVAPLLMKVRGPREQGYRPDELAEPDFLARYYVGNLDVVANAVGAQKQYSKAQYSVVALAASLVLIVAPPLAGWALGTAAGDAVAGAAGAIGTYVGGFPLLTYESANQIYSTYQEQEDVRFALGAYAVLGVDRYFDAAARATSWWQTGLSVFGNAVMLGAQAVGQVRQTLGKGYSIWRGERMLAQAEAPGLAEVRALPPEVQRDLAVTLLQSEANTAKLSLVSDESAYLKGVVDELQREMHGIPRIPEDPVVAALEREAVAPVEQFGPTGTAVGKPDALRIAKDEIAEADLLGELREAAAEKLAKAETAALGANPKGTTLVEAGIPKPAPLYDTLDRPYGMPIPNARWQGVRLRLNGVEITTDIDLGDLVSDKTTYFFVYRLKSAAGLSQEILDDLLRRGVGVPSNTNPLVVKVQIRIPTVPKVVEFFKNFPGIERDVAARMLTAQDGLGEIPQLKITGLTGNPIGLGGPEPIPDVIFQRYRPEKFEVIESPLQLKTAKNQGKAQAFLELQRKLIDKNRAWLDANSGNVYFEPRGSAWICGVLDQDMIGTMEELTSGPYANLTRTIMRDRDGLFPMFKRAGMTDAKAMTYTMLVKKGWLSWDEDGHRLVSGWMRIQDVLTVFPDLEPFVNPAPGAAPKHGQRRPSGFEALRDLVNVAGRPRYGDFGLPVWAVA